MFDFITYEIQLYVFQNQRDSLIESNRELERKLEQKDIQLQEKDEELFQQIEKVFRLEEDCEKVETSIIRLNDEQVTRLIQLQWWKISCSRVLYFAVIRFSKKTITFAIVLLWKVSVLPYLYSGFDMYWESSV